MLAHILLPLWLLNVAVSTDGMVMCTSQCGHVAIEIAHNIVGIECQDSHCSVPSKDYEHHKDEPACDSCDECTDIALGQFASPSDTSRVHAHFTCASTFSSNLIPSMPNAEAASKTLLSYSGQSPLAVLRI